MLKDKLEDAQLSKIEELTELKIWMEVTSDLGKHQFLYKTKSKNIEQGSVNSFKKFSKGCRDYVQMQIGRLDID